MRGKRVFGMGGIPLGKKKSKTLAIVVSSHAYGTKLIAVTSEQNFFQQFLYV